IHTILISPFLHDLSFLSNLHYTFDPDAELSRRLTRTDTRPGGSQESRGERSRHEATCHVRANLITSRDKSDVARRRSRRTMYESGSTVPGHREHCAESMSRVRAGGRPGAVRSR